MRMVHQWRHLKVRAIYLYFIFAMIENHPRPSEDRGQIYLHVG
jgi:hypothetical protein